MSYKRILVPVATGTTSARGLAAAIRLAKTNRASLLLLHVVEDYPVLSAPEGGAAIGRVLDSMRRSGKGLLQRLGRRVARAGLRVQTSLVEEFTGRVADLVVREARRWKADVIVMGTHGRRGVKRMLLGSDAEIVVRYSPVPVLLIPAAGRGRGR
jgi:nucleotide-binding universal stress UspA family protein